MSKGTSQELFLLRNYIGGMWTFLALADLELNLLAFIQRSIALYVDVRVVNKQLIATIIGNDEAKPLFWTEPFYCTSTHLYFSWVYL